MQYIEISTPKRKHLIALELPTLGRTVPYNELFESTDVSGWELWQLYSHNNFDNPVRHTDEQRYKENGWWAEILRDKIRQSSRRTDRQGRLNVIYTSHANTEWQQEHDIWAPKSGWYVPTEDGIFVPKTLIPFETVMSFEQALKKAEAKGMPKEQVSWFGIIPLYDQETYISRIFNPDPWISGRVGFSAGRLPSGPCNDRLSSRPAYREPEIIMKLNISE